MDRPKQRVKKPHWDYHELQNYIEKKHGIDLRNYAGRTYSGKKDDAPYLDFWHWLVDQCEVRNGCYIHVPVNYFHRSEVPEKDKWIAEILELFKEFEGKGEDGVYCWVEW